MKLLEKIKRIKNKEEEFFCKIKKNPKPLMLFGAGSASVFILKRLRQNKIEPVCFCDNNPDKQGTKYLGLPVYSYKYFKNKYKDNYYILITIANMKEILKFLIKHGEKKENIFYMANFRDPWSQPTDYNYIKKNIKKFEKAFSFLNDDFSRQVYINILKSKISCNEKYIERIRNYNQYFDKNIIKFSDEEVYLDVGAYTGDSIRKFLNVVKGKFKKIIAFEPDKKNFKILKDYVNKQKIKGIKLLKIGAWNKKDILSFTEELLGSSGIKGRKLCGKQVKIKVNSIDNILKDKEVTFIKMDVEGSEHNAILGAKKTIKKNKPKLAISVYHKRQDLYDIILLLKSLVPEYKFYLRHYSDTNADTILYAIYDERKR